MKPFFFPQYSPEWWEARRGIPTASEFDSVLTPKTGKLSAGHASYAYRLIGELFDPLYPRLTKQTLSMQNGSQMEPEARRWYELRYGPVKPVGFCLSDDGRFGASPDALIGDDGLLELKNPEPATHVSYLDEGGLPADYKPQVHGQLIVTGRKWCDFMSYSPGLPPLVVRVEPGVYTEVLKDALDVFAAKLAELRRKIEGMVNG